MNVPATTREDGDRIRLKPDSTKELEAPGVHPRRLWSFSPRSDRQSGDAIVSNFLLHWFPAKVSRPRSTGTTRSGSARCRRRCSLLLVLSGGPLLFLYVPSVERAYASVKDIEYAVTFGSWIRSVHRIAAHLMVAAVFLHMVRVFLTGAYKNGVGQGQQREWNWVIGVAMLLADAVPLVHRLPAAVGPARLLGRHRRHEHRLVGSLGRAGDPRTADRRPRDRPADADPLLRAARHRAARRPRRAVRLSHVARPEGRRAGARGPRDAARQPRGGGAGRDEDLHAARRRAGHSAVDQDDLARGAGHDGQRGARSHAAGRHRHARHHRRRQHPAPCSCGRRSRSRQTRSSRPTRRRRRGTSSGCRRSSPTRRSASGPSRSTARSSAA